MSTTDGITGSCLCRQIKYKVTGAPRTTTICHCNDCRKVTGSAFVTDSVYLKEQVHILTGDHLLKTFDNETDSGNVLSRSFCQGCGSPLFVSSKAHPQATVVTAGSMDFGPGMNDWAPQQEYYSERRAKWFPELKCTEKRTVGKS